MTDPQPTAAPDWGDGEDADPQIIWRPDPTVAAHSRMAALIEALREDWDAELDDYDDLHAFSIDRPHEFWLSAKDLLGLEADPWGDVVLAPADDQPGGLPGVRFFPEARLSFAAHCLRGAADDEALVWTAEGQLHRRLTRGALREAVRRCAWALRQQGVGVGDRVAALVPHTPEAIIGALAASAIGAVFSSASPDFGADGVLERFGQITPTVLLSVEGYLHKGKLIDLRPKLAAVAAGLPSLRALLVLPYGQRPAETTGPLGAALGPTVGGAAVIDAEALLAQAPEAAAAPLAPLLLPFDHPLYVLYSSGTTGKPKCIVHGAGGTLLQHAKEHQLHCDVRPGDRVFYYTTAGWMMWNWLLSALASGATLLLFDGNPTTPDPLALFAFAEAERCTLFGTSAKFIDSLRKLGARPADSLPLAALRLVTSTGSPLSPEGFDWVVRDLKPGVQIASISGGTDIIGCFMLGNPLLPVRRGELQCKALGMAVEVWDEEGQQVFGQTGELVCTRPFPSMPVMFWGDPEGRRYHEAYFNRFPGVWCHGDWTVEAESGGFIITGRSDATLNPGGVRIGTAELYRVVEAFPEVAEAVVIGQDWDNDVRVVLFVRMAEGQTLDAALEARLRAAIREGCSPRHVPAVILPVADIPRTKSGKITELAVRRVVMGLEVKNTEALANPEALELFRGLEGLAR
jgi:acetoacetyl-CoA synthetase